MNVSLLLTSGRLGDLLAPGKLFLLGLVIFTGASALCGFSSSLATMVAARALQGVGASLMLGIAPKLIALAYGEGERGLALGLFSTAFATGISVGAPLGGIITTYLGWPYIFFINLPIGARLGLTPHRAEAPVNITNPRRKSLPGARRSPNRPLVKRSETFIRR
ncbi:MAG: MFS transporter, partial [Deltaproteobacteria bacterium]|nr:MFS transporter [Deltaproteobacteria bacterium]